MIWAETAAGTAVGMEQAKRHREYENWIGIPSWARGREHRRDGLTPFWMEAEQRATGRDRCAKIGSDGMCRCGVGGKEI